MLVYKGEGRGSFGQVETEVKTKISIFPYVRDARIESMSWILFFIVFFSFFFSPCSGSVLRISWTDKRRYYVKVMIDISLIRKCIEMALRIVINEALSIQLYIICFFFRYGQKSLYRLWFTRFDFLRFWCNYKANFSLNLNFKKTFNYFDRLRKWSTFSNLLFGDFRKTNRL